MGDIGSIFFCFTVFPPPSPSPSPSSPRLCASGARGGGGIIFITLCTNASRANGKRQSNLLLQGISWLPAGSGRNFALPSLLGLEAAWHQHRLCFTPQKTLSCSCNSSLFLLRKTTEGMISVYGVPREASHQHLQQVGLGELLMTLLDLRAKHQVAFPQGVFDCLPLLCSPSTQWEFSAFKSFLFNSKSL